MNGWARSFGSLGHGNQILGDFLEMDGLPNFMFSRRENTIEMKSSTVSQILKSKASQCLLGSSMAYGPKEFTETRLLAKIPHWTVMENDAMS